MDALIARYLDGTLTDSEADALLEATTRDERLEAELRSYEEILAAAVALPAPAAPPSFTDDVMQRLEAGDRSARSVPPPPVVRPGRSSFMIPQRWWVPAAAASILFLVTLGFQAGRFLPRQAATDVASDADFMTGSGVVRTFGPDGVGHPVDGLQLVRFTHEPARPDVRSVTVAGTFNDWDPTTLPLHSENGVWVAYVLLPADRHEYMFVEDAQQWVADPAASVTVDDGFGNENAVLDLAL